MTEPDARMRLSARRCAPFARRDGDDFVINGSKHFISHADVADFVILCAGHG